MSRTFIEYRCPKCGSTNVGCDAFAVWNAKTQQFELGSTYDFMTCLDCECERDSGFEPTEIPTPQDVLEQHRQANKPTHPLKEVEIVLAAARYWADETEDSHATDNALNCARDAAGLFEDYYESLGFTVEGAPPPELLRAEEEIRKRLKESGDA